MLSDFYCSVYSDLLLMVDKVTQKVYRLDVSVKPFAGNCSDSCSSGVSMMAEILSQEWLRDVDLHTRGPYSIDSIHDGYARI